MNTPTISKKDHTKLINAANHLLSDYHARIALYKAPESILQFYERHQNEVKGDVVLVRNRDDVSHAAKMRNHGEKVFFIFSDLFRVDSYFSGVCHQVNLPQALINRVSAIHQQTN